MVVELSLNESCDVFGFHARFTKKDNSLSFLSVWTSGNRVTIEMECDGVIVLIMAFSDSPHSLFQAADNLELAASESRMTIAFGD